MERTLWDRFRDGSLKVTNCTITPNTLDGHATCVVGKAFAPNLHMTGNVVLTLNATDSDQCRAFQVRCPYVYVGRGAHRDVIVAQVPTDPGGRLELPGGHYVDVDGDGLAIKVTDANDSMMRQDFDFLRACARFKDDWARRAFPLPLCYLPDQELVGHHHHNTLRNGRRSVLVTQAMGTGTNLGEYVQKLQAAGKPIQAIQGVALGMAFAAYVQRAALDECNSYLGDMHEKNIVVLNPEKSDQVSPVFACVDASGFQPKLSKNPAVKRHVNHFLNYTSLLNWVPHHYQTFVSELVTIGNRLITKVGQGACDSRPLAAQDQKEFRVEILTALKDFQTRENIPSGNVPMETDIIPQPPIHPPPRHVLSAANAAQPFYRLPAAEPQGAVPMPASNRPPWAVPEAAETQGAVPKPPSNPPPWAVPEAAETQGGVPAPPPPPPRQAPHTPPHPPPAEGFSTPRTPQSPRPFPQSKPQTAEINSVKTAPLKGD